jgi:hypothetical protein
MPPDRLAELRRQRALVAQHLAWIDAELTAAGAGKPPAAAERPAAASTELSGLEGLPNPAAPAAPVEPEAAQAADPVLALANARADEIIEKYRATDALDPNVAKRGCLVLFVAFFVLGVLALLAIYHFGGYARNR